jgi:alpha-glucuronidase
MHSGRTLWQELCDRYFQGRHQAEQIQATWQSLADKIHPDRHRAVEARLVTQVAAAAQWRDDGLQYFQRFSRMPIAPLGK